MATVRESVILTFNTAAQRKRALSVPNPLPAAALSSAVVGQAAQHFVDSDIFHGAGALVSLYGAVRERVSTNVIF